MNTKKKNCSASLDPRNARVHDKKNENAIAQSLRKNGAGRSIVIDSENVIIGGNGVFDEAQKLGLPVRIIESDGSELIAIRRTDLKTSDAKRKALAIADNRCSDLSYFDDVRLNELLKEVSSTEFADAIGFDQREIDKLIESVELKQPAIQSEVEFAEELMEYHNYIVLYFDNDIDWLQAQSLFNLKTVKDSHLMGGQERRGIGRVLNGAKALNTLLGGRR